MQFRKTRLSWLTKPLPFLAALTLLTMSVTPIAAESGPDYAVADGWFFSQAGGGQGNGFAVRDLGTDANGHVIKFWTEFRSLGAVDTLGYPVAQPYVGSDGFTYQPFQRAILQWRPELGRALLSNSLEALQSAGRDSWLLDVKGVPKPIIDDGSGGDYAKAVATRLGWLTNDAIKAKYLANPNPDAIVDWSRDRAIELYGLPMSQPEQHGPFMTQRFQRGALQLWTQDVAGMPPKGSVVGILAGDLMKEAGLLPASSMQALGPGALPIAPPTPTVTPSPTATPTPAYPWRITSSQGWPNCGTTYIRAYTRDANGNGVNGMTLKSWNDYGNEYIASTKNYMSKDGYWDRVIGSGAKSGKWYVMLIDGQGRQSSDVAVVSFTGSCDPGKGNVQEAELEFRPN